MMPDQARILRIYTEKSSRRPSSGTLELLPLLLRYDGGEATGDTTIVGVGVATP